MRIILRTLCNCERIMHIPNQTPPNKIVVPLKRIQPYLAIEGDLCYNKSQPITNREFELNNEGNSINYIYYEVFRR